MTTNGNSRFIKGIFWTLIIGSFAWATLIGGVALKVSAANDKDSREKDTNQDKRHYEAVAKGQEQNTAILILLAELKKDIRFIRHNGD